MLISTGFCWCENNVLKEKKQNFVLILVKSIYSMAVFQSIFFALHSQTSLRLIYSDVHRLCCMSAHLWRNHWSVCGTLAMGWIRTSYLCPWSLRCVQLHAAPHRPAGESSRLHSGAELKAETWSLTFSAPGSDALTGFGYSYNRWSE